MLPRVAEEGLADAVDGSARASLSRRRRSRGSLMPPRAGLPVKLHANQLSDLGGGALAARYGALSADHLEYSSEESVRAMAEAGPSP